MIGIDAKLVFNARLSSDVSASGVLRHEVIDDDVYLY